MIENPSSTQSPAVKDAVERLLPHIEAWYEQHRKPEGGVDTNVMCAGAYATDHLANSLPLTEDDYRTKTQVKGAGRSRMIKILASHGETRPFRSEAGRTSRGTLDMVSSLAELFNAELAGDGAAVYSDQERKDIAWILQRWFVDKLRVDFFDKQRLEIEELDHRLPVATAVAAMIEVGRRRRGNAAGAVAEHLVGAKLELRFPKAKVRLKSYTTSDDQAGEAGDFLVGDTAVHVTMSPGEELFKAKCRKNLNNGYRPRVLVPADKVAAAVQLRELADLTTKVAVQSIEDFVGTNIEEIAGFTSDGVKSGMRRLLETYNARVEAAEVDKSLMVEIPQNL